jgi:hypothetical protein
MHCYNSRGFVISLKADDFKVSTKEKHAEVKEHT